MKKDITIPKGYDAKIEGDKIVFFKKESEDEKIRKELSAFLWDVANGSFKSMPSASMCQKWAVYLNKQKEQYPVKWSEEDEIRLKEALEVLDESIKHLPIGYGYTKDVRYVKDWLKSLRPQPGLSKEDFIKFGNREYERGRQDGIQFAERTRWRPSEEQREAVFHACNRMVGDRYHAAIYSLYNELKKLI